MNPLRVCAWLPIRTAVGSPRDSQPGRTPPMTSSRRRALRAVLSALAGGGLTAASLSGPLAPGALAALVPTGATGSAEGPSVSTTTAGAHAGAQQTTAGQPSNTTATTP